MMTTPTMLENPDEVRWDHALEALDEAQALAEVGELQEAEARTRAAVVSLDTAIGAAHPDAAHARVLLASLLEARGAYDDAADLQAEALAAFEPWADTPEVWQLFVHGLRAAAANACTRGHFAQGRRALARADELARAHAGDQSLLVAHVANDRGVVEKLAGCYDAAAVHYETCLALLTAHGETASPSLLHNLAGLACARGRFGQAEQYARRALAERRAAGEGDSLACGADLAGLGDALVGLGQLDAAVESYVAALACYTASGHGDHAEVAYALHNLADVEAERGLSEAAERHYLEAITRKRALFGSVHHELAASYNNLAALYFEQARQEAAERASQAALDAARDCPRSHPVRRGCEALGRAISMR